MSSRQWDDLIVLCATTQYDGMPMGDWHLARELGRLGPVLFVDPPMSRLTPLRRPEAASAVARPRLTVLGPGFARLTPVVQPGPSRPGLVYLSTELTRRYLRRATGVLGGQVRAVISGWPLYPVKGACRERISVYWAKDDFVGGAALLGESARLLDVRERRVAAAADLVVAANPLVAQTWRRRGLDPVLIPFGTDTAAYERVDEAPTPSDLDLPGPVAGVVGRLNNRTDLALLEAIAADGQSLVLVGPRDPGFEPERFTALTARPNVRWVGPKPFEALPSYLKVIDVGLVPYRDSAFNRGSFPLKTLEYLAAGRPVVATDLPATRWLLGDLGVLGAGSAGPICVADGPADFAVQARRLAAAPRTAEAVANRREFASRHSWANRARAVHTSIISRCSGLTGLDCHFVNASDRSIG
ncbi:MAG TPA: glycosyltransferase [Streptosporangiaceae bacterium]|jgi:teichuronic acid biosynthesis glycosyltransferase TuaH|nr:glycosyltransferase [Streptosporangiaceae bacterium]